MLKKLLAPKHLLVGLIFLGICSRIEAAKTPPPTNNGSRLKSKEDNKPAMPKKGVAPKKRTKKLGKNKSKNCQVKVVTLSRVNSRKQTRVHWFNAKNEIACKKLAKPFGENFEPKAIKTKTASARYFK